MRILIREDDELTAKALTTILSNHNYAVEVVTDGQAGWELVEAFAYDLILLNVVLTQAGWLDTLPTNTLARLSNANSVSNRSR